MKCCGSWTEKEYEKLCGILFSGGAKESFVVEFARK